MKTLDIKENSSIIRDFYTGINELAQIGSSQEGNITTYFANVLNYCAKQFNFKFDREHSIPRSGRNPLRTDGTTFYSDGLLRQGIWEAKVSCCDRL